jgi:hypothetical protein
MAAMAIVQELMGARKMAEGPERRRAVLKIVRAVVRLRKAEREHERGQREAGQAERGAEFHRDMVERERRRRAEEDERKAWLRQQVQSEPGDEDDYDEEEEDAHGTHGAHGSSSGPEAHESGTDRLGEQRTQSSDTESAEAAVEEMPNIERRRNAEHPSEGSTLPPEGGTTNVEQRNAEGPVLQAQGDVVGAGTTKVEWRGPDAGNDEKYLGDTESTELRHREHGAIASAARPSGGGCRTIRLEGF